MGRLRILMVIHTAWSRNLGGPRVQLELSEELRVLGHDVSKFSLEDAFGDLFRPPRSRIGRWMHRAMLPNLDFARKVRCFIRRNAASFDVIDANQTDLPYSKAELSFEGLLVARSVGLIPAYEAFERQAKKRWPTPGTFRERVHAILSAPARRRRMRNVARSFEYADLINVSNTEDLWYVQDVMGYGDKVVKLPFGLSQQRLDAFRLAAHDVPTRLKERTIAFIGTWNARKGARDWPEIVRRIRGLHPGTKFQFLGTALARERVCEEFCPEDRPAIEVIPRFESDQLPSLLAGATVGVFPGYLEGFGFGVLEKLAAGLPTVTYDAPGARETMGRLRRLSMVPPGDIEALVAAIGQVLRMPAYEYAEVSSESLRAAHEFKWARIAEQTAETYEQQWRAVKGAAE